MRPVAAIGGTSAPPALFERLARFGVDEVVLAFDNDGAGRGATAKAVEAACRAKASPSIRVLDPARLGESKDPDAFVRDHGIEAFQRILGDAEPAITWRANELVIAADRGPATRQTALARAGRWLGTLPPRLALEQEDAVKSVAERCGYSTEATVRAFQARFWPDRSLRRSDPPPALDLSAGGP